LPPKGMRTEPAPIEPSNRSVSPRREAHLRLEAISRRVLKDSCPKAERSFLSTDTAACFTAPLVFRNSRLRSAIFWPFQRITIRGDSVTTAT
jgi:hypothetical protein